MDAAVCGEPLSVSKFPDRQGKAGNFADSGSFDRSIRFKSPRLCWPISGNSLANGTGNFNPVSGKSNSLIRCLSGNAPAIQTGLMLNAEAPGLCTRRISKRLRKIPLATMNGGASLAAELLSDDGDCSRRATPERD